MKYLAIFTVLVLATACQPPQDAKYDPVPVGPPPSEKPVDGNGPAVTQEEQEFFESEQREVERIFRRLGHKDSLKKLPIVLTSKEEEGESWGKCVRAEDITPESPYKEPQIRISGKNMSADLKNKNVKNGKYMSLTRITLLHELGHCYFKKNHNSTIVSGGRSFRLVVDGVSMAQVPQSMMIINQDLTELPKALSQYYVGELLNRWRATTLSEMAVRVPGAKVVSQQ